ncbi:MAG: hypothetical protein WC755_06515 [Candidatus Woesearchaeota archaeon]|jgi:hypothetical protein
MNPIQFEKNMVATEVAGNMLNLEQSIADLEKREFFSKVGFLNAKTLFDRMKQMYVKKTEKGIVHIVPDIKYAINSHLNDDVYHEIFYGAKLSKANNYEDLLCYYTSNAENFIRVRNSLFKSSNSMRHLLDGNLIKKSDMSFLRKYALSVLDAANAYQNKPHKINF